MRPPPNQSPSPDAYHSNRNYFNTFTWRPALQRVGVPDHRKNGCHALRHFYAGTALHEGKTIKAVSEYLGHAGPAFTLQTFTHLMEWSAERTVRTIDSVFGANAPESTTNEDELTRSRYSQMTSSGAIECVAQGVYRMAGAPPQDHDAIYGTWLALGGATTPRTNARIPEIVAAGVTAAVLHDVGDFFLDNLDFIVPARKGTRLPSARLRIRALIPRK